jgi:hypothetical protein
LRAHPFSSAPTPFAVSYEDRIWWGNCARHALRKGDAQRIQRAYEFAGVWYGRHLDTDWRKWTVDEARQIFARFGFEGPVWELPQSGRRF